MTDGIVVSGVSVTVASKENFASWRSTNANVLRLAFTEAVKIWSVTIVVPARQVLATRTAQLRLSAVRSMSARITRNVTRSSMPMANIITDVSASQATSAGTSTYEEFTFCPVSQKLAFLVASFVFNIKSSSFYRSDWTRTCF